jgi:hypothetical protein
VSSQYPSETGPPHVARRKARTAPATRSLAILIAMALAGGIWGLVVTGRTDTLFARGSFKGSPDRAGWSIYSSGVDGWSFQFPSSWRARRIDDFHRGSPYTSEAHTIAITNVDHPLRQERCDEPPGGSCWSWTVDSGGLPADGIIVQVGWSYGGGFSCDPVRNTPRPLSLARATRSTSRDGAEGTPQLHLFMPFVVKRTSGYKIAAWVGSRATPSDLNALEQIVASIYYDTSPEDYAAPANPSSQC